MITAILIVLGLCFGSFTNALVWRLHEQATQKSKKKPNTKYLADLSISTGRSMCPDCKHELGALDLLPVISWVGLRGKCRYCHKPISAQYPLVELLTAALFVLSYACWPLTLHSSQDIVFGLWLVCLVGFMALTIYDLRWMLLPNRLIFPLTGIAAVSAGISIGLSDQPLRALINTLVSVVVGSGLFYLIYQVSQGKWIGGGDVKLGWLFGLLVATPGRSFLVIFLAALLGSLASIPLLFTKRLKSSSQIPFGPFLIAGTVIVVLFGAHIIHWYTHTLLGA
jgi:prepilin signal peptidase PulO-like enzyme (type II secretory pathway)